MTGVQTCALPIYVIVIGETAVAVHPFAFVTVTVYVVFAVGETEIVFEVAPVFHAYVPPPLAVRVVTSPIQIFVLPEIFAVGAAPIVTVVAAVLLQEPFETITE